MIFTVDFETLPIIKGAPTMPKPVGVSIKCDDKPSVYSTMTDSTLSYLRDIVNSESAMLLFHNAKFDLRVMQEHLGIPIPDPSRIIDTMIMAYLVDPREDSLGLKELSDKYCNMPPDEQDELQSWLRANKLTDSEIYKAPFELVKKYAESDTDRTYALYQYFTQVVNERSTAFQGHYAVALEREMKVIPIVIDMEQQGVNIHDSIEQIYEDMGVDFDILNEEISAYGDGEKPGSKALFNVLLEKGYIDESKLEYTEKGNVRYGREFLEKYISDKELLGKLTLRSKMQKILSTYVKPYAESAAMYDGKFYPYYNQTRGTDDYGTKTGRFSSNFQQLSKDKKDKDGNIVIDPSLISVRSLVVAKPDHVLLKRDFSGQELRVAAHYAEGKILDAYNANPRLDVHSFIQSTILQLTGLDLHRDPVKTISFLKLYRGGAKLLAAKFNLPLEQARAFFQAYDEALPEFENLMKNIEEQGRQGIPIRTWGGRYYLAEKPSNGRDFYYKLGNVLIQGSSADMTKEAMIRYHYHPDRKGRIFMQVHDELVVEVNKQYQESEMALLKWAMDDIPGWDVPLCSEGAIGTNFGQMVKYEH